MPTDWITLADASRRLRDGTITSQALLASCLERIDAHEGAVGAFISQTRALATRNAIQADSERKAGHVRSALHGIPYTLKDIIDTAGILTTGHSRSRASNVPTEDAEVARRLHDAGGVLLGKMATWEFAHGGPSWDILQPPARNPWRLSHDPSGSSSGSAAAVAAGFCLGSIGSDTGGSIRGPAAACGVTGLKPTFGRVSRFGVIPNSYSHDHVGPIAWSSEDVALLLQIIAGHDARDTTTARQDVPDYSATLNRPLNGLVVGVPYHWFDEELPASKVVRDAFQDALRVLQTLGAKLQQVTLPPLRAFEDSKKLIAAAELFAAHRSALKETPERLGQSFRLRVFGGGMVSAQSYLNAQTARIELSRQMQQVMSRVDVLALPTGEPASLLQPNVPENLLNALGYVTAFCVTGNPALATRAGFTSEGLPLSLQIAGRLFDEATVLNVGHQYEMATEWRHQRPSFLGADHLSPPQS